MPKFATSANNEADLLSSLRETAGNLKTALPGNFGGLCSGVRPSARAEFEQTNTTSIDQVLTKWSLPKAVNDFIAQIKYAESVGYQTFNFIMKTGETKIQEFVAAGRNYGGNIFISFISVEVSGSTIPQYVYW